MSRAKSVWVHPKVKVKRKLQEFWGTYRDEKKDRTFILVAYPPSATRKAFESHAAAKRDGWIKKF